MAGEDRLGQLVLQEGVRRTLADDQRSDRLAAEAGEGLGHHVQTLLHHQAAQEGDDDLVVGHAQRPAPGHVLASGSEAVAVDAASPDADPFAQALLAQQLGQRGVGGQHTIAAAIEAIEIPLGAGAQPVQAIIGQVGLETRMQAGHDRQALATTPAAGLVAQDVRRRQVDGGRLELSKVGAQSAGQAQGQAILAAAGQGDRRCGDQLAGRLEGRRVGRGRVHSHLGARVDQVGRQPVEGLVGAVTGVVVIAGKQRQAQAFGGFFLSGLTNRFSREQHNASVDLRVEAPAQSSV